MNTKERIITAFKDMARSQGFYGIRMEELAARAGITKKTIYSYFTSKRDLVETVVTSFMEDMNHQFKVSTTRDAQTELLFQLSKSINRDWVLLFNARSLQDLQTYYPETYKRFSQFRVKFCDTIVEDIYSRTKNEWLSKIDKRILREAFIAMQDRFYNQEFLIEMGITSEQLAEQLALLTTYPYW